MKYIITPILIALTLSLNAQSPENIVTDLYAAISYHGDVKPDFERASAHFLANAQLKWVLDTAVMEFSPDQFFAILKKQIDGGLVNVIR